jgi:hypothetical protein
MSDATPPVIPEPEPGDDLAANRPGHELQQKSAQLRQAHPVLTLIGRVFKIGFCGSLRGSNSETPSDGQISMRRSSCRTRAQ